MTYQRSIKLAFDKKTNVQLDANEIFKVTKDAFEIRRKFHAREIDPYCYECNQPLGISTSIYDRLFFRHYPSSEYCIFKDGSLSVYETEEFNQILIGKESDRHKYLKNKIASLLKNVEGVEESTIGIDNKFIFHENEKRKPDVYCKYLDKELVFEIQLSNLPLRYILDRYNFYRKKGIYLIWILDQFDIYGQSQMVRDIKYLSNYQNFFKLDELHNEFRLKCTYKYPLINERNQVVSPWRTKSVPLNEVQFGTNDLQIYFFDYAKHLTQVEKSLIAAKEKEKDLEQKIEQKRLHELAIRKVDAYISKIATFKKKGWPFYKFPEELNGFNEYEIAELNARLGFVEKTYKNKPILNHYLSTVTSEEYSFIVFLLEEERIHLQVNKIDDRGMSCFQNIYTNSAIPHKTNLLKNLFRRGYKLLEQDITFFKSPNAQSYDKSAELSIFRLYDQLKDRNLVNDIYFHERLMLIIESAKQHELIGFRYNNWISFGINAIHGYKAYWEYIEVAFKKYKLWDTLINADKKGTFQKKLDEFYKNLPEQNFSIDPLMKELYQDLFE